jgi:hypothetical protein
MRILTTLLIIFGIQVNAQTYAIKDIKSFGAKGDGKTNDHDAFEKAALFFNQRGGNGRLLISKGIYMVGKQSFTQGKNNKPAYEGEDLLHFSNLKNLTIEGAKGVILKYKSGLRFGAFKPENGQPYLHGNKYFVNWQWAATLGHCIFLDNCHDVTITNIEMDGSNTDLQMGGIYGDVGIQLPHYGIFVQNSRSIKIKNVNLHHFALDGISISNAATVVPDEIELKDSQFEYNSRQGLSWIGGNGLKVKNCKFNHTGQGKFFSFPGAGLDIEAEAGPIRNGRFENCEFIDNKGCAMVADSGDSGDCSFDNCTFWGLENWSVWTTKPRFTFTKCDIYGSIVHGYDSPNDIDATKYIECHFEDKAYNGKPVFGIFLIEINNRKRLLFDNCTFLANTKKLCWIIEERSMPDEERATIRNSKFIMANNKYALPDYIFKMENIRLYNTSFVYPMIKEDEFRKRYEMSGGAIKGDGRMKNIFKK